MDFIVIITVSLIVLKLFGLINLPWRTVFVPGLIVIASGAALTIIELVGDWIWRKRK